MRVATHLLAGAALLLGACDGRAPDAPANTAEANAAAGPAAIFCAFEQSDTKDWTGRANADQSVTVEGQAYVDDPKYKAALLNLSVQGSVARIYVTKAENTTGEVPRGGWWPVNATIPDDGSIRTVEVWCDMDTRFAQVPVRRGTQSDSQASACPIQRFHDFVAEASSRTQATVRAKVDVKSEGYTVTLSEGAFDKTEPPVQHVTLNVVEPTGPVAQKLTTHDVELRIPIREVGQKVAVDCGGKELARDDIVRP